MQTVSGQSERGTDGVFGKTWVEAQGGTMRIVSGYARRVVPGRADEGPQRFIQIVDVPHRERMRLYPERSRYSRGPLGEIAYGHAPAAGLKPKQTGWRIASSELFLSTGPTPRRMLGVDCAHYRVSAFMTLEDPRGRKTSAGMIQHVWVAPAEGALSQPIIELIAFDNEYRRVAGGALSPLDHERYQAREASAIIKTPQRELRALAERARERLRELPGYPVASSVSWWRCADGEELDAAGNCAAADALQVASGGSAARRRSRADPHALQPTSVRSAARRRSRADAAPHMRSNGLPDGAQNGAAPAAPSRLTAYPQLQLIDWSTQERKINTLYDKTLREFRPERQKPLREETSGLQSAQPTYYPDIRDELKGIHAILIERQEEAARSLPPPPPPDAEVPAPQAGVPALGAGVAAPDARERPDVKSIPLYEIYAELHGLEISSELPAEDFRPPPGYKEIPRAPGADLDNTR